MGILQESIELHNSMDNSQKVSVARYISPFHAAPYKEPQGHKPPEQYSEPLFNLWFHLYLLDETLHQTIAAQLRNLQDEQEQEQEQDITKKDIYALWLIWDICTKAALNTVKNSPGNDEQKTSLAGDEKNDDEITAKLKKTLNPVKKHLNRLARAHNIPVRIAVAYRIDKSDKGNWQLQNSDDHDDNQPYSFYYAKNEQSWRSHITAKNNTGKGFLKSLSRLLSIIVSVGQGLVGAFLAGTTGGSIIFLLLLFTTSGFICNYILLEDAAYPTLKEYLLTARCKSYNDDNKIVERWRPFIDNNGKEVSFATKVTLGITMPLSFSAGVCLGMLALMSCVFLGGGPVGWAVGIGTFLAVTSLLSFTFLFHSYTGSFIKNGGYDKVINFLKKVWDEFAGLFGRGDLKDKPKLELLLQLSGHLILLAAFGVATYFLVTAVGGLFFDQLVSGFTLLGVKAPALISAVFLSTGAAATAFVYASGVWSTLRAAAVLLGTFLIPAGMLVNRIKTGSWSSNTDESPDKNLIRVHYNNIRTAKLCLLVALIGINAYAQSSGAQNDLAMAWVKSASPLYYHYLLGVISLFAGSFGVNYNSAEKNCKTPAKTTLASYENNYQPALFNDACDPKRGKGNSLANGVANDAENESAPLLANGH